MRKGGALGMGIVLALGAVAPHAQAAGCDLKGEYGYVYDGVSYDGGAAVEIAETGSFVVDAKTGSVTGTAKATFRFPQSLWVLLRIDFAGDPGAVEVSADPCQGIVNFKATGTVLKSSPSGLEGVSLFADQPRSIAYTVSGKAEQFVDLISTSAGSVLSGTAKARRP